MDTERHKHDPGLEDHFGNAEAAPLIPASMAALFFRPRHFFSGHFALGSTPYLLFVILIVGIAGVMRNIENKLAGAELGGRESIYTSLAESWLTYWGCVVLLGVIGGVFLWALGGWWYRMRIRFSGAKDVDPQEARLVYIYASYVWSLPNVLWIVAATLLYANFLEYWHTDELWSSLLLVFPIWSVWVSYRGAREVFEVKRWPARIWLFILPIAIYTIAFLGMILLFALKEIEG
ncbi:MAG: hypothetical protein GY723_08445 [bacterium]|nr:hypothetical protein [bacterium]